jgi:DNA-binding transcriptional MerR regulator
VAGAVETVDDLSTSQVSQACGYSVQQVRDLEAFGVIAPARRAGNGYRRFSQVHVRDLGAYRDLACAVGPVAARAAMRDIRALPPDQAAALVSSFHVGLNRQRDDALAARRALLAIRVEATTDAAPAAADTMTITELAEALGVRASTLRFWEKVGLVTPQRVTLAAGSARRYPVQAVREARITAALRAAGYGIPDVQRALAAVRQWRGIGESLAALDARVDAIGHQMLAMLRAGSVLCDIIAARHAHPGGEQGSTVDTRPVRAAVQNEEHRNG